MKILITGCAGFIGSTLVDRLLLNEHTISGVDNFNDYYDPKIKWANLKSALDNKNFQLNRVDVLDILRIGAIFEKFKPDCVVHLAARAGVRPSIEDPILYAKVNVTGTVNLLQCSVKSGVRSFIFGSSSSVYGNSPQKPFSEDDLCDSIYSPYGASKRAAEFFAESFFKNFGLRTTILRFFTVYGPRGRPDMAPSIFTNAILNNKSILKFGDGNTSRDYTYISDVIDGIVAAIDKNFAFEIINLGGDSPITLNDFIKLIETITKRKSRIKTMAEQQGDVEKTWANIDKAKKALGWQPKVNIDMGFKLYVEWLKSNLKKQGTL